MVEQSFANSFLPEFRAYEDIVEKQPCPALEGGIKLKKHGIAGYRSIPFRNHCSKFRMSAEAVTSDIPPGDDSLMAHSIVFGKFMNQVVEAVARPLWWLDGLKAFVIPSE